MRRHVTWLVMAVLALFICSASCGVNTARADRARDAVAQRARGLRHDVRYMPVRPGRQDEWQLSLSLGYAWSRDGRPAVDPNGVALGLDVRRRFVAAPLYLGGSVERFFGELEAGRLRLGLEAGTHGQLGDFELQAGLSLGPLIEFSEISDRTAKAKATFYIGPSARLLRHITNHFYLGVDFGYLVVVKKVDALRLKLVVGLRWW